MPLSGIPLDLLTADRIDTLRVNAVLEGRRLEYKRELPGGRDDDKREFLADVSSFANSSGGDLILGIAEEGGVPKAIQGVKIEDPDAEIRRLDDIIRNGIDPRLPGVHMRAIPLQDDRYIVVIRVPQSWGAPHMVTFKNYSRFFSRNSAGKVQLDVSELRALFARSGTAAERIKRFRDDRLAKIIAGEGALEMNGSALVILHLVPLGFLETGNQVDLRLVRSHTVSLAPLFVFGWDNRYNLDGFVTYRADQGRADSYVQVFRYGVIEAVNASMLAPPYQVGPVIPGELLVTALFDNIPKYLETLRALGVSLPVVVMLAIVAAKGFRLAAGGHWGQPIDRELVQIPELLIEDWELPVKRALQPTLDALWNAAGWVSCSYYDEAGEPLI